MRIDSSPIGTMPRRWVIEIAVVIRLVIGRGEGMWRGKIREKERKM